METYQLHSKFIPINYQLCPSSVYYFQFYRSSKCLYTIFSIILQRRCVKWMYLSLLVLFFFLPLSFSLLPFSSDDHSIPPTNLNVTCKCISRPLIFNPHCVVHAGRDTPPMSTTYHHDYTNHYNSCMVIHFIPAYPSHNCMSQLAILCFLS